MELKAQKAALARIKQLKEELKDHGYASPLAHEGYGAPLPYSMVNLERDFIKYLKEFRELIEEYSLDKNVFLEFKKEAAEILYDQATVRNNYRWAALFAKEYGL